MLRKSKIGHEKVFLKDWQLAKVALSCHMALDMLCQEMREACQEALCHMQEGVFSHRGRAATSNGKGCGERMKEKKCQRRAPLSLLAGQFPSKVLMSGMVCLWSEGIPSFLCVTVWCSWF